MHETIGAHLLCVNNYYAKFEYKVMNFVGVTDYTNKAPLSISDKKCLSSTPAKNERKILNVQKIGGAHLMNHYAKFEYKGVLFELQITQTRHLLSILDDKNV